MKIEQLEKEMMGNYRYNYPDSGNGRRFGTSSFLEAIYHCIIHSERGKTFKTKIQGKTLFIYTC